MAIPIKTVVPKPKKKNRGEYGNTYVKYIERDEDIPLVSFGFPILDRVGHSYFPTVGYRGGMRLLEKILDALLDRKDRDSKDTEFELVM